MRVTRVRLQNIRTFEDVELSGLPSTVLIVGPNGAGKSTILEAIVGAHELVSPYSHPTYPHRDAHRGTQVPTWPPQLRPPLMLGASSGSVEITVEASPSEVLALGLSGSNVGSVRITIEAPRHVVSVDADAVARSLFAFHPPSAGVGYIDFIRSNRLYPNLSVGNLSAIGTEASVRNVLGDFHRGPGDSTRFHDFKTLVVTTTLNDATERIETGEDVDSLKQLKDVFNLFFSPKRFIGPKRSAPGAQIEMLVETPYGTHDTDLLSDGEKEVLHILTHFFNYGQLANVVLWDTPEANLNSALEARLHTALTRLAPMNQYLFSTHGLELIESVPPECVYVVRPNGRTTSVSQLADKTRAGKVRLFRDLGARVGIQAVSSLVVFVGGRDKGSEQRQLQRLLRDQLPSVSVVAVGGVDIVLGVGSRAMALLEQATADGDFLAVIDRDYRSEEDVLSLERQYDGKLFIWRVHEFENLFLNPDLLWLSLQQLDRAGPFESASHVAAALRQAAMSLSAWIAADWVRWELHSTAQRPAGRIPFSDPQGGLRDYALRLRAVAEFATDATVAESSSAKSAEVGRLLASDRWSQRLPGKEILRRFLADTAPDLPLEDLVATCVSMVVRGDASLPEIDRLSLAVSGRAVAGRSVGR